MVAGAILSEVQSAALALAKDGISVGILSMHTVKPLDASAVVRCLERSPFMVIVEEHNGCGGLAAAVLESLVGADVDLSRIRAMSIQPGYEHAVGSRAYLLARSGLDSSSIAREIGDLLTSDIP